METLHLEFFWDGNSAFLKVLSAPKDRNQNGKSFFPGPQLQESRRTSKQTECLDKKG